jgi:hypothetical protein
MKKQNETWDGYLANKQVRPKLYNVTLRRKRDGTFEIVSRGAQMLNVVNEYKHDMVTVNARSLAKALRNNGIVAK